MCCVGVLITAVLALFLPLDISQGYTADHADRAAWLANNRGAFILGWTNQILAMLTLSGIFLGIAWKIGKVYTLRAIIAAAIVFISVIVFLIPKFIAVWTIPLLADNIATASSDASLANTLLLLLNVSVPYSLFTSFDYLGFWLYAVFGLLVARTSAAEALSVKIAAWTLGVFGVIYHVLLITLLWGSMATSDIETWFLGVSALLIIVPIAMIFGFRGSKSTTE